jgi:hypothetical protein
VHPKGESHTLEAAEELSPGALKTPRCEPETKTQRRLILPSGPWILVQSKIAMAYQVFGRCIPSPSSRSRAVDSCLSLLSATLPWPVMDQGMDHG